jgi:hypothetical protein
MTADRRRFLQGAGSFLFLVGGTTLRLTPAEARRRGADFRVLDPQQVATLEALGEILVPGARAAGLAHFVDSQLAVDANDSLLIARAFNVEPPYRRFYADALAAVERLSERRHGRNFAALAEREAVALVREMSAGTPDSWSGPPAPLVYVVLRSDAVDVAYGTVAGFARLGVPYLPHILPPAAW